jgi:hypothetical protein
LLERDEAELSAAQAQDKREADRVVIKKGSLGRRQGSDGEAFSQGKSILIHP